MIRLMDRSDNELVAWKQDDLTRISVDGRDTEASIFLTKEQSLELIKFLKRVVENVDA